MKIRIFVLSTLLASVSNAEMRAELKLNITPTLNIERTYQVQENKGTIYKPFLVNVTKVEVESRVLDPQAVMLIAYMSESLEKEASASISAGSIPKSSNHVIGEFQTKVHLSLKEDANESFLETKLTSVYKVTSIIFNTDKLNEVTESYRTNLAKVKISGVLTIQYFVPLDTRILQISSSDLKGGFLNAVMSGFEGTLSEELEKLGHKNRYAYVQPSSVLQQVIEVPEQEFESLEASNFYFHTLVKRNLHLQGVK